MRIDEATLSHLQEWIGKSERYPDQVTAAPYRALSATLNRNDPEPNLGVFLPELWHWLYFLPHPQQSEIGPDGHAKRGASCRPSHFRAACGLVADYVGWVSCKLAI